MKKKDKYISLFKKYAKSIVPKRQKEIDPELINWDDPYKVAEAFRVQGRNQSRRQMLEKLRGLEMGESDRQYIS